MSESSPTIRAVVDIGTNSVKLLVAETSEDGVTPLHEDSEQTRLGRGLYESGLLAPEALSDTAKVLEDFAADAKRRGASSIRVVATSAARDAKNGDELAAIVKQATRAELEIISGDQEAEWVYRGVSSQAGVSTGPLLVSDVGGGSTELILGNAGVCQFARSFKLGTVRQLEQTQLSYTPGDLELSRSLETIGAFLKQNVVSPIANALAALDHPIESIIGVGGTTTFLARIQLATEAFDRDQIEATQFTRNELQSLTERMWNMSLEERRNLPGLPSNRADVILFGAAIYLSLMTELGLNQLAVSTRGVRFGALIQQEKSQIKAAART